MLHRPRHHLCRLHLSFTLPHDPLTLTQSPPPPPPTTPPGAPIPHPHQHSTPKTQSSTPPTPPSSPRYTSRSQSPPPPFLSLTHTPSSSPRTCPSRRGASACAAARRRASSATTSRGRLNGSSCLPQPPPSASSHPPGRINHARLNKTDPTRRIPDADELRTLFARASSENEATATPSPPHDETIPDLHAARDLAAFFRAQRSCPFPRLVEEEHAFGDMRVYWPKRAPTATAVESRAP